MKRASHRTPVPATPAPARRASLAVELDAVAAVMGEKRSAGSPRKAGLENAEDAATRTSGRKRTK